ncbi:MAG TPA: chemotaxis protein CheB [Terriglobia bacterium]|nr:chemotaxis protein CheB [Terriglobia bacterium]
MATNRPSNKKAAKPSTRSVDTAAEKGKQSQTEERGAAHGASEVFPIVGIGASAGGLEAFTQLISHMPDHPGMALVLIQHLAPQHESALTGLLARTTRIPVSQVKDAMPVERDRIYVIPPNTNMAIQSGRLYLVPRTPDIQHLPIDHFLRSLAEELGSRAIGVILSGTASDGTLGLQAIKSEGGITFAQDTKSAKYGDMPRNAVASGCVDFVLSPEAIARELVRIAQHPYLQQVRAAEEAVELPAGAEEKLVRIFVLLRAASGVDFANYKHTTIKRRIKRRMVLHKLQELKDYVTFLEANRPELDALYQDILIHVTGFFRDPQVFEALKARVFPVLMRDRRPGVPVRIWVPGCSTGEEAYSIGIALMEFLGDRANAQEIQFFATDISETSLEKARSGLYLENVTAEVSAERLRRFFVKTSRGYQVIKSVRDMFVFARQDVAKDPPFSRLDLISCRNLLIYLGAVLQKKVIPVFYYALKPAGFLLLGTSETIGSFADHFALIDKKNKIYAKKPSAMRLPTTFARSDYEAERQPLPRVSPDVAAVSFDVQKEAERVLLAKFAPAGVIVNSDLEIIQFRGRTGPYLEASPGQASLNLSKMAREGLLVDLRGALQKAKKNDTPVKKQAIEVRSNGGLHQVDLEIIPLRGLAPGERYYLVLFQESPPAAPVELPRKAGKARPLIERAAVRQVALLRHELAQTKSTLQSVIEEQDTTNEELKSANEEILSSNEELQSTNEELETAKEELQSSNEELTTLNEELQNRNLELSVAHNDMLNLLASVSIPILMLGNDLRIRRFTPQAEKLLNLIPSDVGRPLSDIKRNFDLPGMDAMITDSIDSVTVKEREVQDRQGRWYTMRVRPYRTSENKLDGAVINWIDVTALKASLEQSEERFRLLVDTMQDYAIIMLDPEGRVNSWNSGAQRIFGFHASEIIGQHFSRFFAEEDARAGKPRREMEAAAREGRMEDDGWRVRNDGCRLWANVVLTPLRDPADRLLGYVKVVRDMTEKMRAQRKLQESESSLRQLSLSLLRVQDEERRRIGRDLHDSVSQYLSSLKLKLDLLQPKLKSGAPARLAGEVQECARVADEALREIRTVSHLLYPPMLDEMGLAHAVRWYIDGFTKRSGIETTAEVSDGVPRLPQETELALYRVLQESLTNVHRHSGSHTARVHIGVRDGSLVLEVSDDGRGISPERTSEPDGWGVGLRGMHERIQQLGGSLTLNSTDGGGTTVRAAIPIPPAPETPSKAKKSRSERESA